MPCIEVASAVFGEYAGQGGVGEAREGYQNAAYEIGQNGRGASEIDQDAAEDEDASAHHVSHCEGYRRKYAQTLAPFSALHGRSPISLFILNDALVGTAHAW
jgi:hypothetical protein